MKTLKKLFDNNADWAADITRQDPEFFSKLAKQQKPEYLWIGCADSRVPANQIVGLLPGDLFVHRNVANLILHSDINALSVIQFAVDVLKVKHIIVCGHYGCGGVNAAMNNERHGLVDNWLYPVRTLHRLKREELEALPESERLDRMCELNVEAQVESLSQTTVVQDAWARNQSLDLHGWIYSIKDGRLKDLAVNPD
ncbi:MAG: carbonate dehydratase [Gammaproteobacteria bacterium]|nr:carbonate dehydratase [Gammaproteobacteria bacterium]